MASTGSRVRSLLGGEAAANSAGETEEDEEDSEDTFAPSKDGTSGFCSRLWCTWPFATLFALIVACALWFWREDSSGLPSGYCEQTTNALPVVLPGPGGAAGERVAAWAAGLVRQMSSSEKRRLVNGLGYPPGSYQPAPGFYIGNTLAIPRLGIPSLRIQDAAQGFRTAGFEDIGKATAWPCSLAVAASWDPEAMGRWAFELGGEFREKGANVVLGPAVNVHRVASGGRNAEYMSGEDPYLGAPLVAAYVRGLRQAGVAGVVKHFLMNEQETDRSTVNVQVSRRVLWEHYYPPFQAAVDAGIASVMCSYNYVNGQQACSNHEALTGDLKQRMGFAGWVMSDWWAIKSRHAAAAGTDQDMPGNDRYFSQLLLKQLRAKPSVAGGAKRTGRFEEMAQRVLQGMAIAGVWGAPGAPEPVATECRVPCDCGPLLHEVNASNARRSALARELASSGVVLLKNERPRSKARALAAAETSTSRKPLPLVAGQTVAVLGVACGARPSEEQLRKMAGEWTLGDYYNIGGSGRVIAGDPVSVLQGLRGRGFHLRESPSDDLEAAERALVGADVAIVCGGTTSSESFDRSSLRLDQEAFITALLDGPVARAGVPAVVVALVPGAIVAPWRHSAAAALAVFLSGQETGHAVADVLSGAVTPSGKLPVTFPADEADVVKPCSERDCPYVEGLRGGWHVYDTRPVAFPFGHGDSYTDFRYELDKNWAMLPGVGADSRVLHVRVTNVGSYVGREVVQLYVGFPVDEVVPQDANAEAVPESMLKGFVKTPELLPGASHVVQFVLHPRDISVWDEAVSPGLGGMQGGWRRVSGRFTTNVCASSRERRLCGGFDTGAGEPEAMVVCGGNGPRAF